LPWRSQKSSGLSLAEHQATWALHNLWHDQSRKLPNFRYKQNVLANLAQIAAVAMVDFSSDESSHPLRAIHG